MAPTPTPRVRRIQAAAEAEAEQRGHTFLGTEHLLLALAADPEGIASRVLRDLGVADDVRRELRQVMDSAAYNAGLSSTEPK